MDTLTPQQRSAAETAPRPHPISSAFSFSGSSLNVTQGVCCHGKLG